MPDLLYLDASALVKLVVSEPETGTLESELASWPSRVSSVIVEVELRRAVYRERRALEHAEAVVESLTLVQLGEGLRRAAGQVGSPGLRSLDAIHLATALSLADDLGAFCCYDRRLSADAEAAGLTVLSPGLH